MLQAQRFEEKTVTFGTLDVYLSQGPRHYFVGIDGGRGTGENLSVTIAAEDDRDVALTKAALLLRQMADAVDSLRTEG